MAISKYEENGKVLYSVYVKVRDCNRKQISKRQKGITSFNEAKRLEFELKYSLVDHKDKMMWPRWVDKFLERSRTEFRNSTYMNYRFIINKWVTPKWEKKFLDEITPSDVHHLVFEHVTSSSSYTRRGILKIIRRIFNQAIADGLLTRNPTNGIKVRTVETHQAVLNKNEIEIFLREAKSINHKFFYHWALALFTGMRSGELHALRWTDVDFVTGFITISKAWTRYNGEGPTKTAKNRVCPISIEQKKLLMELQTMTGKEEFVLPRQWEWDQGMAGQITKDFCRGIGISAIRFHDLRATFITQMLNNGVPLSKVMAIVGHSSLKTTQGYLRLCGKDVEGATEDLRITLPNISNNLGTVIEFKR